MTMGLLADNHVGRHCTDANASDGIQGVLQGGEHVESFGNRLDSFRRYVPELILDLLKNWNQWPFLITMPPDYLAYAYRVTLKVLLIHGVQSFPALHGRPSYQAFWTGGPSQCRTGHSRDFLGKRWARKAFLLLQYQ